MVRPPQITRKGADVFGEPPRLASTCYYPILHVFFLHLEDVPMTLTER